MEASGRTATGSGDGGAASGLSDADVRRRWELVVPHREQLLAIARRRVDSREDAEDAVATAMLRTVEHPALDEARVGAFLCTTVKRLAVDVHRDRTRQLALGVKDTVRAVPPTPVEETVCDEHEARWLAARLRACPERERQVLQARLAGLSGEQVGAALGLTNKAAENAYTRVRRRAQALLAATAAGIGVLVGAGRRTIRPVVLVPVAATGFVGLALLAPSGPAAQTPRQVAPVTEQQAVRAPAAVPAQSEATKAQVRRAPARTAAVTQRTGNVFQRADAAPERAAPPRRVTVKPPAIVDPKVANPGGVFVERRHEDETFEESVDRCVRGLQNKLKHDPLADACS